MLALRGYWQHKTTLEMIFWCNLWSYFCCHTSYKKGYNPPLDPFHVPLQFTLLSVKYNQEIIYYTCRYTYFYILSTVVGKVSSVAWAVPCHWRGLRLQLDSQPLEGDGASSWCWLSPCSGSSDRKLGKVCARGMNVIARPVPGGKKNGEGDIFRGVK